MSCADIFDDRARLLVPGNAQLEKLASGATWSEGPVWMHEDQSVLWSDIPNNRMLRWHPTEGQSVWRDHVEYTNGHYREADGALLHCSHGHRAIIRTRSPVEPDKAADEVVVDCFNGRRLNSPNDLVVKRDGTIWFSDPPYGIASNHEGHQADSELGGNYVFRFEPRSGELSIATDFVEEPNGLAFSPDESVLYVSDTSVAMRQEGYGNHHIVRFDVLNGKELVNPEVLIEISPGLSDGFRLDYQGWIFTSSADSVQVIHPDGTLLAKIYVPEKVGNLTFGGARRNELYICATTSLYRIRLNTSGIQTP